MAAAMRRCELFQMDLSADALEHPQDWKAGEQEAFQVVNSFGRLYVLRA